MSDFICNLPGLIMTAHRLNEGIIEVHEDGRRVKLDICNGKTATMEFFGAEDAAVLRYVADCLEHFEEADGAENDPEAPEAETIIAGATPELNRFALK